MGFIVLISFYSLGILCVFLYSYAQGDSDKYQEKRSEMIEKHLVARDIKDTRVLQAMAAVPRHLFVPEHSLAHSYDDRPISIGYGQTISQPYIVALMTQLLELKGIEKILEIGTGSCYQTAILAKLVQSVYTIEIIPLLFTHAQYIFTQLNYGSIFQKQGDGYYGWPEFAPFDCIIITAAVPKIPQLLIDQLTLNGRLIMPLGTVDENQQLVLYKKIQAGMVKTECLPVRFVPMTGVITSADEP